MNKKHTYGVRVITAKTPTWKKEHKEHPWTSQAQAKRIAADHKHAQHEAREKPSQERREHQHRSRPQKGGSPAVKAATRDFTGLYNGAKQIAGHARNP